MQIPTAQIKSAWPRTTLFLEKKTICITFSAIECQISLLGSLSWRGLLSYLSGFVCYFASLLFHCSHVAKSFSACAQTCECLMISPVSILWVSWPFVKILNCNTPSPPPYPALLFFHGTFHPAVHYNIHLDICFLLLLKCKLRRADIFTWHSISICWVKDCMITSVKENF